LIEAKHNSTLNEKQQKLFDSFKPNKKFIANSFKGFMKLDQELAIGY